MATRKTLRSWEKTLADMVTGKRNPRALTIEWAKLVKDATESIRWRFGVSMSVAEPVIEDGIVVNHTWRARRPDELPENRPQDWEALRDWARMIAYAGEQMEEFADRELAAARKRLESKEVA